MLLEVLPRTPAHLGVCEKLLGEELARRRQCALRCAQLGSERCAAPARTHLGGGLDEVLGGVVGRGEVVQGQVLLCLVHPGVLDQLLHA